MKPNDCKEWTTTLAALSWSHSYWSTLLYEMLKVKFIDYGTLAVGGGILYCNPQYFTDPKFNDNNRIFMVAHEISHEMFFHPDMFRQYMESGIDGEPFDPQRANMAADYIINDMLIKMRVGQYHEDWLHSEHISHEENFLDVYRRLKPQDPPPPPPSGGGGQQGEGEGGQDQGNDGQGDGDQDPQQQGGGGGEGDGNTPKPMGPGGGEQVTQHYDIMSQDGTRKVDETSCTKQQDGHMFNESSPYDQNDWKQAVAGAYQQAKSIGHGSAAMDHMIAEYIETKRSWKEELRDYVTVSRGREHLDWKRTNKRKTHERGIFVPTKFSWQMGDILYIHDVSGSVSKEEHMACKGAGVEIATDCKPKSIRVLCCAAGVTDDQHYDDAAEYLDWQPKGTGGTDMEAAFRYVIDEGFIPELAIVLTDGWTDFTGPPPFPVVWLSTDKEVEHYPYGHAIKLDLDEA